MCVTLGEARISDTRTFTYATRLSDPIHVTGYQNNAKTRSGGNCMFLNIAGTEMAMVHGPEFTHSFMDDLTERLPELEYDFDMSRGGPTMFGGRSIQLVDYGDYTVILAHGPANILSALSEVRPDRRPAATQQLQDKIDFYMSWSPTHSFILACFAGEVRPEHPIMVRYRPHNPEVLTVPGLDGHDGRVPTPGDPVYRDFSVAFAVEGVQLPYAVHYNDRGINGKLWAPTSVTGFKDNRKTAPNGDYVMPMEAVREGLSGLALAAKLR